MFAILLSGSARDVFHAKVKALFQGWIDAIANVLIELGMDAQLAKQGEDVTITIQSSLTLDDTSLFQRTIEQLPIELLDI